MNRLCYFVYPFFAAVVLTAAPRPQTLQPDISFEPNQGQTDRHVKYLARAGGYRLFLTDTGAVMALGGRGTSGLSIRLLNANPAPKINGLDQQQGISNYLTGADATKWVTGVKHYGKVRYEQVYRGVDLVYYGNQRQLEHDFIVAPGADYRSIRLRFDGARKPAIDANGDLVMRTWEGELRQRRPVIYQEKGGERKLIAGGYRVSGREVSFRVGTYDSSRPLIIDPTFIYFSTYLGGSGIDQPNSIAVDAQGNAYVTGATSSLDFPTLNPLQAKNAGMTDVFITKLSGVNGTGIYSTYLGGSNQDAASQIKVDASGNAYVVGTTYSTDFPVTKGAFQTTLKGPQAAFVAKLNPAGNALVYATYLGGTSGEVGQGIDLDSQGDAYVVGVTYSNNFPVKSVFFNQPTGAGDGFLTEINPTGTALVYSGYIGGSGFDSLNSVAVNSLGEANVVGFTNSTDLPTTEAGSRWPFLAGGFDSFMVKVSPASNSGASIEYISYFGGSGDDVATSIAIDPSDDVTVYIAGLTSSTDLPTPDDEPVLVPAGGAVTFAASFQLPGLVFVASKPVVGRGNPPDVFRWVLHPPDECKGGDWGPLLKKLNNDLKDYGKVPGLANDLASIGIDFLPNWVGIGKDIIIFIKDASDFCKGSSSSSKALPFKDSSHPQVAEDQAAAPTPLYGATALDGSPISVPQLPGGNPASFTSVFALAASPSGNIYLAVQTNDATLPVSPSGLNAGSGAQTGYIIELSTLPPTPTVASVVNGASFAGDAPVAPGSLVTLFGDFGGSSTAEAASLPLSVSLGETSVTINGTPVPMYFVNNGQINAQVPWEIAPGPATAIVTSSGVASAPIQFTVAATAPGIFTFSTNRAVAQNQDYSVNDTSSPAAVGSVITVYMTGGGAVDNAIATGAAAPSSPLSRVTASSSATIGSQAADIEFLGMTPGLVGVVQADIKVPTLTSGDYPLVITIGGVKSNAPLVTVSGS